MNNILHRSRTASWLVLSLAWMARASIVCAAPADALPKPAWTVDDALSQESASGWINWRISPDCRWAAWVKTVLNKDKNEWDGNIHLSSLAEHKEVQLTQHCEGINTLKWSPDGQLIAFISTRPGPDAKGDEKAKSQIWLINPFGGEPWQLSGGGRAVVDFEWAGVSNLVFSAQEDPSLHEQANQKTKDDSKVAEDEGLEPPLRLFEINLNSKKVTRLTDNIDRIGEFAVSPDETHVVTVHRRSLRDTYDASLSPVTYLTDFKTGARKQVFTEAKFQVLHVIWQRDGKAVYAVIPETDSPRYAFPCILALYRYDLAAGNAKRVDLDWDKGLASENVEPTAQGFIALLADGVRPKPARYSFAGDQWRRDWITGVHATNLAGFRLGNDDKTYLYDYSTSARPDQWYRATLNRSKIESPEQLTSLNANYDKKPMAKCEIVHWKGALGETVEGLLLYPLNCQPGKKYPLVVEIHGGPASLYMDNWRSAPLLNARGAYVFRPNYHGSTGYGLKWAESILGRLNELEVEDINLGVDYLIERGLVDPDKLAVEGWSQGGTLTAAVSVATNRYKAAIAGDGPIDWIDYWGKSDIGDRFCGSYFGGNPFDAMAAMKKSSSFYQMDKVTTPTLIFFGSEDTRVPVDQGWMYYRALQQNGKAEVRFVLFPGDGHGPSTPAHVRRAMEEELAWLDKHLFQKPRQDDIDLKPDSPLAAALKLKGAKTESLRYGQSKNGKLIPETVAHAGFEVGRFEVTRAQFAQFDRSYAVASGQENFPANGITFDQAKAYCAWLSKTTGDSYRLPNSSEADSLYGESSGAENTLDYWAGEAVNPEDAEKLQTKVRELGGQAPLLKEVGSFKATGSDEPVFDLGGNAAEWTIAADGAGRVCGGSADTPADQKISSRHPNAEYVGLRVVKEAGI